MQTPPDADAAPPTVAVAPPKGNVVPVPEELAQYFPNHEILRILGRGGMGAVYLAKQTSLNRLVAIKILPAELGDGDQSFTQRFKNEAQAMAQLSHPGIVSVYDFGQTSNGLLYIVMEYIDGTDVALMVTRQGRLHSAHAMAITAHVCDALTYAHGKGIVHRDIKPSNIMIGNDGVVKVADFGLAKMNQAQTTALTQSGMAMGTLHFMAPEVLTLGSAVDQRADIYAVGVMLYQMLTGKLPQGLFEMPSLQVPGLDPRYDVIVAKALREDREVRYQAAGELRHDLDAILTQPVERVTPGALEDVAALPKVELREKQRPAKLPRVKVEPSEPMRRRRTGLVIMLLGVSAAVAALFFHLEYSGGRRTSVSAEGLAGASRENPFVNSLGMKFVPVSGTKVLFSIWETRVRDYTKFALTNKGVDDSWLRKQKEGVPVGAAPDHPVVGVSWEEAGAFCQWLSQKEIAEGKLAAGARYRLPTDEEWSIAVGLESEQGTTPGEKQGKNAMHFPWGIGFPPQSKVGNYADTAFHAKFPNTKDPWIENYADGFATTAPVGSFEANNYGLHDLGGNAWEWCEDWRDDSQQFRVLRGGSWSHGVRDRLFADYRCNGVPVTGRGSDYGFRCVLEPQSNATNRPSTSQARPTTKIEEASVEHPFANSLSMKFVPVPIGGGPTKGERVLFSIWDTRVQDYLAFARANQVDGRWQEQQKDGVPAGRELDHPVVGVNWEDAQAFCQWLSAKEIAEGKLPAGMKYRLPSDEEWNWAVGMSSEPGATPAEKSGKNEVDFPWGIGFPPPGKLGNYADETFHAKFPKPKAGQDPNAKNWIVGYDDGNATTSPVGSFPANAYGLYDMGGNVWQWCEDWFDKDQQQRVLRGASWESPDRNSLRSSRRRHTAPKERGYDHGFRCVLAPDVSPSPAPIGSPSSPATATKDNPFINTLGMKFVPVPETQVLFCIHEVRKSDYAAFARTVVGLDGSWERPADRSIAPGDAGNHPVVNVNEADALAFCAWLGSKDGLVYRLPTDHEWSCAVGIGDLEAAAMSPKNKAGRIQKVYPWGSVWPPPSGAGNFADSFLKASTLKPTPPQIIEGYTDGFAGTAPVMSFRPNQLGIYDLAGNVWELSSDWYDSTQTTKAKRGGCWDNAPEGDLRSSSRLASSISSRGPLNGIRVVVERPTVPASSQNLPDSKSSTAATKDVPFVNTLGMKFVPVPITGGPTDKQRVLFSVWETRVQDFQAFAEKAGHPWKAGDKALPTHPAAVNWKDIATFCQWLTERERKLGLIDNSQRYRITTDHEWSCAVGIGDQESVDGTPLPAGHPIRNAYPWGNAWPPPPGAGNFKGEEASGRPGNPVVKGYRDDFLDFSPVGSFPANEHGLYDLAGNAWELCEREIDSTEGAVFIRGGSSANSHPVDLASTRRVAKDRDDRSAWFGFRIVLAPAPPPPAAATKDNPFANTLGMKFVPLPGTKSLMSIHETRNADYAAFATAVPAAGSGWKRAAGADSHPAVNVSWEEAAAFCAWLGKKENRRYRLPTDREWSIAAGLAGQESATLTPQKLTGRLPGVYPWGTQWPVPARTGNYAGSADGFATTAPVMSFAPNALGLFDLGGNVWEFCADGFNESGQTRVLRGASWSDAEQAALLSSCRDPIDPSARSGFVGFRCVLDDSKP